MQIAISDIFGLSLLEQEDCLEDLNSEKLLQNPTKDSSNLADLVALDLMLMVGFTFNTLIYSINNRGAPLHCIDFFLFKKILLFSDVS